jgi:flavin reductase (DIM6/NTAB) family NADH-FMN oxidoreductase RutF
MSRFESVRPGDLGIDPFTGIGERWFLLTAGGPDSWNTMTAGWGAMGFLWRRCVVFAYVRPGRHTFRFMESSGLFTLSFFDDDMKGALEYCGTTSGRDVDKAAATGLVPFEPVPGCTAFEQARAVIAARRIYTHDIDPSRMEDGSLEELYPSKDYHRMYVGEVLEALIRRD